MYFLKKRRKGISPETNCLSVSGLRHRALRETLVIASPEALGSKLLHLLGNNQNRTQSVLRQDMFPFLDCGAHKISWWKIGTFPFSKRTRNRTWTTAELWSFLSKTRGVASLAVHSLSVPCRGIGQTQIPRYPPTPFPPPLKKYPSISHNKRPGTENIAQRDCVTKILANVRVNFLV